MRNLNLELAAIKRELGALHRLTRDVSRRAQRLNDRFQALPPELKAAVESMHQAAIAAQSRAEGVGGNVEIMKNYIEAAADVLGIASN